MDRECNFHLAPPGRNVRDPARRYHWVPAAGFDTVSSAIQSNCLIAKEARVVLTYRDE
jgi:hypothetical protein